MLMPDLLTDRRRSRPYHGYNRGRQLVQLGEELSRPGNVPHCFIILLQPIHRYHLIKQYFYSQYNPLMELYHEISWVMGILRTIIARAKLKL